MPLLKRTVGTFLSLLRNWIFLCIAMMLFGASPPLWATNVTAKPTYSQVQSAWARVLGFSLTIVVWHEECSSREQSPSVRKVLSQSFENWKKRNSFMDDLRNNAYGRARLEGGEVEATRFAKELKLLIDVQDKSIRSEIREGGSLDCSRLLYVMNLQQSDLSVKYKHEVDILRHAVD